jgi:hypothetical protein
MPMIVKDRQRAIPVRCSLIPFLVHTTLATCGLHVAPTLPNGCRYQSIGNGIKSWTIGFIRDQDPKNAFVGGGWMVAFLDYTVGRGRYDSEHWLSDHPSLPWYAGIMCWRIDFSLMVVCTPFGFMVQIHRKLATSHHCKSKRQRIISIGERCKKSVANDLLVHSW